MSPALPGFEILIIVVVLLFGAMWIALRTRIRKLEEENRRLRRVLERIRPADEPPREETVEPSGPSLASRLRVDREDREWEAAVGGGMLNKAGAVVLAIGIALFLTYSYDRLVPAGRAAISMLISMAILGSGILVERRPAYRVFARGLIGTGWAALYATAYAMYALPATRVIANPFVGSLVLLAVAAGMIAHSLSYRAQAVTAVAYFSAFAALAATPSTSFAAVSLIPLAVSLLYLAWRFQWHAMALFGVVATYTTCLSRGNYNEPLGVIEPLFVLYWIVFEGFDLLKARKSINAAPLMLMLPLNAVALLELSWNAWTAHPSHELWTLCAITAALFLISAIVRISLQNRSYEVSLTVSAVLTSLAMAGRLPGLRASVGIAAEAELLYLAGVHFRLRSLRILGALGLSFSLSHLAWKSYGAPGKIPLAGGSLHQWTPAVVFHVFLLYLNRFLWRPNLVFSFAGSALAAFILVVECRSPYDYLAVLALSFALLELWLRKQLVEFRIQAYLGTAAAVLLAHSEEIQKTLALVVIVGACAAIICYEITGRIFRSQIWAAVSLFMVFMGSVTGHLFAAPVWAAMMVAVLLMGRLSAWPDFNWQCYTMAALALIRCVSSDLESWAATSITAACLYAAEFIERGSQLYRAYFSVAGTFLLTALLYHKISGGHLTVAWGLEAAALLVAGFASSERLLRLQGLALLMVCVLKLFLYDLSNLETIARIISFIGLGVLLLFISWVYTRFRGNIKNFF